MIDYGFDSTDEIQYDSKQLPVGKHKVMIVSEEIKTSENPNNPRYLMVEYEIVEGELKNKSYPYGYNLWHTNQTTSTIAKQSMKRIADATGKPVSATSPLKGRVLVIDVRPQKKNPQYNEIFRYLPEGYSSDDIPLA
jgi:hypothetical protein